jgi:ADP-heptose:LPS heptosyltransferase
MRVLILKRDKLGDLLLATSVFAHLKAVRPELEIHLLANDYNAWVARDDPALEKIWVYPRVRHDGRIRVAAALAQLPLTLRMRGARFDWAIAMGGEESPRAVWRAMTIGARRVVAYARNPAHYGARLTDPLSPPSAGHEITRMLALLAPLGVAPPAHIPAPIYRWPADTDAIAREWLSARGLARGRYVVLGVGARFAAKQPDFEQVLRWTRCFHDRWRLPTVFLWTPGEHDSAHYRGDDRIAARVTAAGLPYVHPQPGPLREAVSLIANAAVSILPDSGLMHFAAASPGGVVGLFAAGVSTGSSARWAPVGARARHLEAPHSVAEISDDAVVAALEPLVANSPFAR